MKTVCYSAFAISLLIITSSLFQCSNDLELDEVNMKPKSLGEDKKSKVNYNSKKRIPVRDEEFRPFDAGSKADSNESPKNYQLVFDRLIKAYEESEGDVEIYKKVQSLALPWYRDNPQEFMDMLRELSANSSDLLEPLLRQVVEAKFWEGDPKVAIGILDDVLSQGEEDDYIHKYLGKEIIVDLLQRNLADPKKLLNYREFINKGDFKSGYTDAVLYSWSERSKEDALEALEWFKENDGRLTGNSFLTAGLAKYSDDEFVREDILAIFDDESGKEDAYLAIVNGWIQKDLDQAINWFSEQENYLKFDDSVAEITGALAKNKRYAEALSWANSYEDRAPKFRALKSCFHEWKRSGDIQLAETTLLSLEIHKNDKQRLYKKLTGRDLPDLE